jgi:enoyl-[acyl-carrier protein] reductase II
MNELCRSLGISLPIIQAGMVWTSGAKLAAAAAKAGCLGTIGAGSMQPELLRQQVLKARQLTDKPLAVNVPLLYEKAEEQIQTALDGGIRIFITSAGSPKLFTEKLKRAGAYVIHVVSSPVLAKKCQDAGVDAVVAEGFEAGGHNGRDELTTMVLTPLVVDAVKIPVIAAGGIVDGRGIAAALALGAQAVQMGTRFVATREASAHDNFKNAVLRAGPDATMLMMKKHVPVRLLKNAFFEEVKAAEDRCASQAELEALLGKGRARAGMFDGDLVRGELEIGQAAALINDLPTVGELIKKLTLEYAQHSRLPQWNK